MPTVARDTLPQRVTVGPILQNGRVSLTADELESRMNAEADLLARGATTGDMLRWSPELTQRVQDAADRTAARVDGAELSRVRTRLQELVAQHIDELHRGGRLPPPEGGPAPIQRELQELAEAAAAEWAQQNASWIPDEVNTIVDSGLRRLFPLADARDAARPRVITQARALKSHQPAARRAEVARTAHEAGTRRADALRQQLHDREEAAAAAQREHAAREARRAEAWRRARDEVQAIERANREKWERVRRQEEPEAAQRVEERRRAEAARREEERAQAEAAEQREREEQARLEVERRERWLSRPAPAPEPQRFGVSHEGAERLCAAWMRHLGALDAEVTRFTGDGGIDIASETFVAQVKNYTGSVAVADVRALFGVAVAEGKRPLLFTSGTVTVEGNVFAERVGMALIRYDAVAGIISGLNDLGAQYVEWGLNAAASDGNGGA